MSKAKILHIITRLANGGADENTLYTINCLGNKKYDIDLMIGKENNSGMMENLNLREGIRLYKIDSLVRDISPLNEIKAVWQMYKIIKKNKYDIVHTHIAKAGVLGRIAAKMAGVPIIIHGIHGITFPDTIHPLKKFLFKNIERFCAIFTDHFITVGEDMKKKYLEAGIGEEDRYTTVYSGMELSRFLNVSEYTLERLKQIKEELGIDSDDFIIGNVSKIQKRKGYIYYLNVARNILSKYDKIKFLIVGSGPYEEEIKKQVSDMGLSKNVIFTGYRTDVENMFAIMDIKVLTSLWEGLPRVLVQAAATGKPIVSFDVDGAWEIVEEGKNGFIVPLKDTDAMIEKIIGLINDNKLREKMGSYSRTKVNNKWTVENMVKEIDMIYAGLLKDKGFKFLDG
ncbi:glycosyltransferase [Iocasia frigidifontis]|uniref:Glycosyltransferase n=1 Tax=Iocasia fonsfrigidae TaxID=2682810 RepID=A0A8A7KIT4_9FIRM|nr:glycosyltransferase family 4 protein [Iocasia fonsfrigidae]QTL99718.1 glycosyltransferase [Iocasia fonsfrigidae]